MARKRPHLDTDDDAVSSSPSGAIYSRDIAARRFAERVWREETAGNQLAFVRRQQAVHVDVYNQRTGAAERIALPASIVPPPIVAARLAAGTYGPRAPDRKEQLIAAARHTLLNAGILPTEQVLLGVGERLKVWPDSPPKGKHTDDDKDIQDEDEEEDDDDEEEDDQEDDNA